MGSVRLNHKDWGAGIVLDSDLQRGGTHARHRPTISGVACAGWGGFRSARLPPSGPPLAGVVARGSGRGKNRNTPHTPQPTIQHNLFSAMHVAALRRTPMRARGGCVQRAHASGPSPHPVARSRSCPYGIAMTDHGRQ